jgi:prepilin-type processing-associated H-X9-DG protein
MKFTFRDLMVGVAVAIVMAPALHGQIRKAREAGNRARCSMNLRQLGMAMRMYENDCRAFPRTAYNIDDADKPTWGTPYEADKELGAMKETEPFGKGKDRPADNDVTASLYLLMRTQDIVSELFACPGAKNVDRWDFGGGANNAMNWTNWQGNVGIARHLSYSMQNPFASKDAVAAGFMWNSTRLTSEFAIASDMSPGTPELLTITRTSNPAEMRKGNSLNHRTDGQNVLYGDGHVEWKTTPFAGVRRDNIFTAAGPEVDAEHSKRAAEPLAIASPVDDTDSILLPTAKDIGYVRKLRDPDQPPLTREAMTKMIVGDYNLKGSNGTELTLQFGKDQFTLSDGKTKLPFNYTLDGEDPEEVDTLLLTVETERESFGVTLEFDGNSMTLLSDQPELAGAGGTWTKKP